MKRALLALLIVAGTLPALAGDAAQAPRDMVVLTVSGMVGKTNRGPLDAKRDSLLAVQKVDFKNAFAFDRATLLALRARDGHGAAAGVRCARDFFRSAAQGGAGLPRCGASQNDLHGGGRLFRLA